MVITYHGGEFAKITFGAMTLAFNPISKDSKLKNVRFGADLCLITLNDEDFNGAELMSHGEKEPFVVNGPGEYEVQGIFIHGFSSISRYKTQERINTIYSLTLEGMKIGFLGALSDPKLSADAKEALDGVDILFVPIGGEGVISPGEAHELSVELEAKIVIPIHYPTGAGSVGSKDALAQFIKQSGGGSATPAEKLTLKQKDLDGKEGEVVVLEA